MSETCDRCESNIPVINNIADTSFLGLLRIRTTTNIEKSLGVQSELIKGFGVGTKVLTSHEDYKLCDNCWSSVVTFITQNRPMEH